jgi:hypothetical protein
LRFGMFPKMRSGGNKMRADEDKIYLDFCAIAQGAS